MENTSRYQTYQDFFPFYLREHSKKSTRVLHYFGTLGYQVLFWSLIVTQNFLFLPLILLAGYGPAWIGHFFYEKVLWHCGILYNSSVISVARKFKSICRKLALFEFALPSSTCKLAS